MTASRFAAKAICLAAAAGLAFSGVMVSAETQADASQAGAQQTGSGTPKTVCKIRKRDGKQICRKVSSADPKVTKSSGFIQTAGAPLIVGTAGISAAALNGKNCGRGNNANTGGGQNNGNCANSP